MEITQLANVSDVVDQHVQSAKLFQYIIVKLLKLIGLGDVHRLKKVAMPLYFLFQGVQSDG